MKRLNMNDLQEYFKNINDRFRFMNKYGYMILAGGAAMTVMYNQSNTMSDIDALFEPRNEFRKIITYIANEYDIESDWLNDGIKGFLSNEMTSSIYKNYSNLSIEVLDPECLLAMKLTSARTLSKDMSDSMILMRHLNITTEEQLFDLIMKYIPKQDQIARSYYFTKIAFEKYSNERTKLIGAQVVQSIMNRKDILMDKYNKSII